MPSRLDFDLARRFRELAAERHPGEVLEVRIFGSRARDEAGEDSDLDLFVLTRSDDTRMRDAGCCALGCLSSATGTAAP